MIRWPVFLFVALWALSTAGQSRPNVLWITCEDMSPNLGCYGDPYADTPVLDALASESMVFDRAYATAPVCSPARSAMFFGMYQGTLGVGNHRSRNPTPDWLVGFPTYIRDAGYFVTNHTKTDFNSAKHGHQANQAFAKGSSWRDRPDEGMPFFSIINLDTTHASRTTVWPRARFEAEVQSQLDRSRWHDPGEAPVPPYLADTPAVREDIARYYDCISVMDDEVGEILSRLEEDGLADDTIVFFFSDHGAGLPRHKSTALDSGLRVPLLIRVPERFRADLGVGEPMRTGTVVSFLDLSASVVELATDGRPEHLQGESVFGLVSRSASRGVVAARDRIDERIDAQRSLLDGRYVYLRSFMPQVPHYQPSRYQSTGVARVETYRLVDAGELSGLPAALRGPREPEELYDLRADPQETTNLIGDPAHAEIAERMRSELRVRLLELGDVNLIPEAELVRLGQEHGVSHDELSDRPDLVPLGEVHRAAWLVGGGEAALAEQLALASHRSASVRFWAATGLHQQAAEDGAADAALSTLAADGSPIVCAAAAWALVDRGESEAGFAAFRAVLEGEDVLAAEFAVRAIQLLGEAAVPLQNDARRSAERLDSARMQRCISMFAPG